MKQRLIVMALIFGLCVSLSCVAGGRIALVVGNSRYEALKTLKNPHNDAQAVAMKLRDLGFQLIGGAAQIDLSETDLLKGLKKLKQKALGAEMAFLYYAGHGAQWDGQAYLLPVNMPADAEMISRRGFDLDRVVSDITGRAELTVAVFDACREIPELDKLVRASFGGGRHLRSIARTSVQGTGQRIIAFSAGSGGFAEDGSGNHSPYTAAMLNNLDRPGLEVGDLFRKVAYEVRTTQGQRPEVITDAPPGRFYFREVQVSQQTERSRPTFGVGHLTIKTSPEGAKIRILNIAPKYQQGMTLKAGRYQIEVSHQGYQRKVEWIEMGLEDMVHSVVLALRVIDELELEFVRIQPGCFQMGSPTSESGRYDDETRHRVCLTQHYELGQYEVTQGQWEKVMGSNPSRFTDCGSNCPVEQVSWDDIQEFIRKLNRKTGRRYRLPTEAEWEYTCRSGGRDEKYCGGNDVNSLGWYDDNSGYGTHRVGQKRANGLGIYDMSGNVWEWVEDWKGEYPSSSVTDPKGPGSGSSRVVRGGSWYSGGVGRSLRSAYRNGVSPDVRRSDLGFRLARTY